MKLKATLVDGPFKGEVVDIVGVCYERVILETRKDTRRYPELVRTITYRWGWDGKRLVGRCGVRRTASVMAGVTAYSPAGSFH